MFPSTEELLKASFLFYKADEKAWTVWKLSDFYLKALMTLIQISLHYLWSSSGNGRKNFTATISLFIDKQNKKRGGLKMSKIHLEYSCFDLDEKSWLTEWWVEAPSATADIELPSWRVVFLK